MPALWRSDRAVGRFSGESARGRPDSRRRAGSERDQVARQAVVDRAGELRVGIGRRWSSEIETRGIAEGAEGGLEIGQVLAPVQGRQALAGEVAEGGEMEEIDVEMEDVEAVRLAQHASSMASRLAV